MAEAIGTGLATEAIKKAIPMARKRIKFPTESNVEELRSWKSVLEDLLKNQDPFEVSGNTVKLRAIRDMLDKLLDERATISEQKKAMGRRRFAEVRWFISSPEQLLLSPFRFARKYNKIMQEIGRVRSQQLPFIANPAIESSAGNQNQMCSSPYVGDGPLLTEKVFGRDKDREKIIPLICNSNGHQESVSVAAIVGIGGQGKTTLAQYVCSDQKVKACFDAVLWVSCTPHCSFSATVRKIIEYATSMKPLTGGSAQLYPEFFNSRSLYEGKKILIVLDNIWYQDSLRADWVTLKTSLQVTGCLGASGCKFLITTRNEVVPRIMDAPTPYMLNDLSEGDSLLLFQQFARVKGQDPCVEPIEKEIVELCPKVPLVVKNIGCQLAQRHSIGEWQDFKDTLAATSTFQVGDDKVLETLKLSYDQLDEKLKLCAAYCSLFPTREFKRNRMVLYWMALGFVQSLDDGEECIRKLVIHGFFNMKNVGTQDFQLHDVMYDLITWVGKSEHQRINNKTKKITKGVRHVSLQTIMPPNWDFLLSEFKGGEQLQSIVAVEASHRIGGPCTSRSDMKNIISKFPNLRVLELPRERIEKVPKSIGELIHLRCLDLAENPLRKLPKSITKLVNLLCLNLSGCDSLQKLPTEMGDLLNLRSLKLSDCWNLEGLPSNIGKLLELRHLEVMGCDLQYMPKGIGNLTKLETLDVFVVGEKTRSSKGSKSEVEAAAKLEELGHLNNLQGGLHIYVRQHSKDIASEAGEAHLEKKSQLTELRVIFERRAEEDEMFLACLRPSGNKMGLIYILNYGGKRLPKWITDDQLDQRFPKLRQMFLFCNEIKNPIDTMPTYVRTPYWSYERRAYMMKIKVDSSEGDMLDQWVGKGYSRLRKKLEMRSVEVEFIPGYFRVKQLGMGMQEMEFAPHSLNGLIQKDDRHLITNLLIKEKFRSVRRSGRQPKYTDDVLVMLT